MEEVTFLGSLLLFHADLHQVTVLIQIIIHPVKAAQVHVLVARGALDNLKRTGNFEVLFKGIIILIKLVTLN